MVRFIYGYLVSYGTNSKIEFPLNKQTYLFDESNSIIYGLFDLLNKLTIYTKNFATSLNNHPKTLVFLKCLKFSRLIFFFHLIINRIVGYRMFN